MMASAAKRAVGFCQSPSYFEERAPWWGGDLQTLRNQIIHAPRHLESRSRAMRFPMLDDTGDVLTGSLEVPLKPQSGPLIILIHGLTGCENSVYVRRTACLHLARGRHVLRLNLRGAGSSRNTCSGYYHAGCADDIRTVLDHLDAEIGPEGVFLIGYSLGGNILINFLARLGADDPVIGAASVSAPIRPGQAALRLMAGRNFLYQFGLLKRMKKQVFPSNASSDTALREAVLRARSVYEFDDIFTAPRNGFRDVEDYYEKTSGVNVLADIRVPFLMIHAENDPWIPVEAYRDIANGQSSNIEVRITKGGGHVGFHGKGSSIPWHDRCTQSFLEQTMHSRSPGGSSD